MKFKILNPKNHPSLRMYKNIRVPPPPTWDLRFYPMIENLILTMLSYIGCHAKAVHWLYWNLRTWSASDVIVLLKRRHHVMPHLSVFMNFCEPFIKDIDYCPIEIIKGLTDMGQFK